RLHAAQTFSCINPIMCPVALVYFIVNYIGERYNNIYVFRRDYESAGKLWKTTFSCINPIICPAALAYFMVTYLGERYNNIYVFRRDYESAGKLWKTVYGQVMVGLYIMQLTMLGLLGLKKFPFAALAVPLLLFTVGCHFSTFALYRQPW
ncbi:putative membrane protein C2G11.09, partial [Tetrabaena socialis]